MPFLFVNLCDVFDDVTINIMVRWPMNRKR